MSISVPGFVKRIPSLIEDRAKWKDTLNYYGYMCMCIIVMFMHVYMILNILPCLFSI